MKRALLLIFALITGALIADQSPAKPHVTVFIHGTVGSFLHLPLLHHILKDKDIAQHSALQVQQLYRKHKLFEVDQLASIEFGLQKLEECAVEALTAEHQKKAWYHLLAAFKHAAQTAQQASADACKEYMLFGWSGVLSNGARKQAGFELYQALVTLQEEYQTRYGVKPVIDIIAHSHGGNVALWLAHYEEIHKKQLELGTLCLLGTPLQKETVFALQSPFFPAIISFYSKGDFVHASDYISTQDRKSHYRLHDIIDIKGFLARNPQHLRVDAKLVVDGDDKCIDHANLFLSHRGNVIFKGLESYPCVVYLPLMLNHIREHAGHTRQIVHLQMQQNHMHVALHACVHGRSQRLSLQKYTIHALHELHKKSAQFWRPFETSRSQIFNKKNATMIWDALKMRFGAHSAK